MHAGGLLIPKNIRRRRGEGEGDKFILFRDTSKFFKQLTQCAVCHHMTMTITTYPVCCVPPYDNDHYNYPVCCVPPYDNDHYNYTATFVRCSTVLLKLRMDPPCTVQGCETVQRPIQVYIVVTAMIINHVHISPRSMESRAHLS